MKKTVTESTVFITWLQNSICYTKVKKNATIGLKEAIENTEIVRKISQGALYPMLVDLREIHSITKEARDHFSMKGRQPGISAIAMLIKSPVSRIIGNFFIGMNRSTVPTKLFTLENKAKKWLEQFILN